MKTIRHFLLITCLSTTGIPMLAAESIPDPLTNEPPSAPATAIRAAADQPQPPSAPAPETANMPAAAATPAPAPAVATNAVVAASTRAATKAVALTNAAVPPVLVEDGTNGLRLNFRN